MIRLSNGSNDERMSVMKRKNVLKGTIEYSSAINHEPYYRLINFQNGSYAVEMMSLSGNQLSDLFWVPGDTCCALFALTQDEFELKDSDIEALNNLITELYTNIPEDRLMDAYYNTALDNKRKPMSLRPRCKSMDNNKIQIYEKESKSNTGLFGRIKKYLRHLRTIVQ